MLFRSFFDEKLAQYTYLVGCQRTGEALVIDPARQVDEVVEAAKKEGLHITAATETHIHADFVSGSRQLAEQYGVKLYLSDEGDENWKYGYTDGLNVELLKDGSKFSIGNIDFEVMHTPGHTPESISFVLTDRGGGASKPMGIFTGDFVFVGDVGRPDLLEKAAGAAGTADSGARDMYRSVQRFKELPDYLMVWPAHGAGSACGKSLGAVPSSTVGYEKQFNWAMQINDEQAFVDELLKDQPEAPIYFAEMKKVNKIGPAVLQQDKRVPDFSAQEVKEALSQEKTLVIDTRPATIAEKTLLPGSINVPYNKSFTNWVGWLANYDEDLVIIGEPYEKEEILESLQSIHFDRIVGYASVDVAAEWEEHDSYETLTVNEFTEQAKKQDTYVLDVRNDVEWGDGHLEEAHHHFLGKIRDTELPKDKTLLVYCQGGARSAIASSVLKSRGFEDVKHMAGGYGAYLREQN
ncbi:MBL fold metallo-hydrolase [Chryseomicrobium excrementi]|uniref:MBL fold metallo-hydrolase n=1 Tax=Chryseomicrobium excrementi TaxID=2041346 RepID=A0A2M9EWX7_9BACL|nr:MBL fold metallo-hydrolase [Chryseomicrobium excrementi]PJK15706.1 MBL fold metallo-hydrolase [Chryseomicrobium excrementi]